jgi:hypothetical protein
MLEENKTQNTNKSKVKTKTENRPIETASPEIKNKTEISSETIPETEEKIETEPKIKLKTKLETPTQPESTPQPQIIYKTDPNIIQKLLTKARAKIQERKRKKLDKIMTLFNTKSQITNKDIQKLLRTTKRSSTRYLDLLEQEQKITQIGKTGKAVFYIKK